jgi:hypothetical protein
MTWTSKWIESKGQRVAVMDDDMSVKRGTVHAVYPGAPAMSIVTDDGERISAHPEHVWLLIEKHKDHDHESQTSTPLEGSTGYHCDAVYQSGSWRT